MRPGMSWVRRASSPDLRLGVRVGEEDNAQLADHEINRAVSWAAASGVERDPDPLLGACEVRGNPPQWSGLRGDMSADLIRPEPLEEIGHAVHPGLQCEHGGPGKKRVAGRYEIASGRPPLAVDRLDLEYHASDLSVNFINEAVARPPL